MYVPRVPWPLSLLQLLQFLQDLHGSVEVLEFGRGALRVQRYVQFTIHSLLPFRDFTRVPITQFLSGWCERCRNGISGFRSRGDAEVFFACNSHVGNVHGECIATAAL